MPNTIAELSTLTFVIILFEKVVSNEIRVIYCHTEDMVADIMTKGLSKPTFEKLRDLLCIHDVV